MDESTFQTNLNTLKEMVLDEDRLVTYVSLSKELCIHLNESKLLLRRFIDNITNTQPGADVNISYIVSGLADNNKAFTSVCSEADLGTVKERCKVVFFQHVYSVGKGQASVDNVSLMAVNKFEDFHLCTGLIKSNVCLKRTTDEIGNLKSNSQEVAAAIETKSVPQKKTMQESKDSKTKVGNGDAYQKNKIEITNKIVNGDSDSFVSKIQESKSEPSIKSEVPSPKSKNKGNNKSQKGIAGFFTKSSSVPSRTNKNDTKMKINNDEPKMKLPTKNTTRDEKETTIVKDEQMDVDDSDTAVKAVSKEPDTKKTAKSLNNIKKNAKVDKKRKRVLHVSDSESDEEKNDPFADDNPDNNEIGNMESDDEIPPTPLVNTVKITSGFVNPKKRRKIVDKTYTDEEGYILTKKEEIYESCSENEAEVEMKENKEINKVSTVISKNAISPEKKNGVKSTRKKVSPPQKGKQATLMNFFKKI